MTRVVVILASKIFFCSLVFSSVYAEVPRHEHNGVLTPYLGEPPTVELTAKDKKKLAKEKPVYKKIDVEGARRGIAVFRVNASSEIIWSVIKDFESYPLWIEDVKKTTIYKQEGGNIYVRFDSKNRYSGKIHWYIHHDYPVEDRNWGTWRMDYNYQSDLDDSVGFWRVLPVEDSEGQYDVIYSADLKLKQRVPSFVTSLIMKSGLKDATQWVKQQSEIRSSAHWKKLKDEIRATFPKAQQLTIEDFGKNWQQRALLVDVRDEDEFAVSHIPGAIHLESAGDIAQVANGRPVVVYCSVGYRSSRMATLLSRKGITAMNLEGSIFEWANSGRSVVNSKNEKVSFVHPFDEEWGVYLDKSYHADLVK